MPNMFVEGTADTARPQEPETNDWVILDGAESTHADRQRIRGTRTSHGNWIWTFLMASSLIWSQLVPWITTV